MRKASLIQILVILLVSLFLLSVLSSIFTGYPERQRPGEDQKEDTVGDTEEEQSLLLFRVSPVWPRLYWRVSTADYYTGLNWRRTTDEKDLEEFPQFQDANATEVFTVEINTSQQEIVMPLPPANSTLANISSAPIEGLKFYVDTVGNVYKAINHGQAKKVELVYEVSWRDVEVDDRLVSHNNISEEILNKYLQLPIIPNEVWKLARDLEDPSYSILDQVLADVQYLRTNFVYDVEERGRARRGELFPQVSDVYSYMKERKGICFDAATALAVILRMQKIPARMSFGYKPEGTREGKILYYTTGAHAVTEVYLPPYGWIEFDATPPLEKDPLLKVCAFKKESSLGSRLFYQLSITNRHSSTGDFKLFVYSKQKWNVEVAPKELEIKALQTADALLEVTVPDDADIGEKDVVTVSVVSWFKGHQFAFSIVVIIQAEDIFHISTTTSLKGIDETVIRGDTFWVNGTVLTASDERVDNMTIFIFLTKSREAEGMIVGKGYSKEGNFQIECAVPYFMEIGDYKVVPISLGTTQYAPSDTDSIIRVCATTRTQLDFEKRFLLGYGAIHGRLLWDNRTGIMNAPISLEITSVAKPSEVWRLQNSTFKNGFFRIETTFENPGVYEVIAMFSGNEYILGSRAIHFVRLERGVPAIQIFGENTAIRGELFNITGAIQFDNIGVWGEPITVAFDNQLLATIRTGFNGTYTWSFLVDPEETLGSHFLTVSLKRENVSAVHKFIVKSKTRLATKISNAAGGMLLLFSASLSDDHNLPIQGTEIVIDNYGLSWKTDKNGNLTFLLDTAKLWPENLVLTTKFEGSELYLPATTQKKVVLGPMISLPFLIPLVSPTLAIMVFVYTKHHITRRRARAQQTSIMEIVKDGAMVEEEHIRRPQKMEPLRFVLPDIEAQFLNVWGVRDKLRMEVVLDNSVLEKIQKREVEVFIDEEPVASVRLSPKGRAELSHVFIKKGKHKVRAILPRTSGRRPWKAEIKLRVVDYGEEIIRLYNEFLGKLDTYGILARNEMTAREIESLILRMRDFGPEALRKVTTCFEKVEYSNHLTTRKDYEIMYLSLNELNIDVE